MKKGVVLKTFLITTVIIALSAMALYLYSDILGRNAGEQTAAMPQSDTMSDARRQAQYSKGKRAMENEDWDEAIACFTDLGYADSEKLLVACQTASQMLSSDERTLLKALKDNLDSAGEWMSRGRTQQELNGRLEEMTSLKSYSAYDGAMADITGNRIRQLCGLLEKHTDRKLSGSFTTAMGKAHELKFDSAELSNLTIHIGPTFEKTGYIPSPENPRELQGFGTYDEKTERYGLTLTLTRPSGDKTLTISTAYPLYEGDSIDLLTGRVTHVSREYAFTGAEDFSAYEHGYDSKYGAWIRNFMSNASAYAAQEKSSYSGIFCESNAAECFLNSRRVFRSQFRLYLKSAQWDSWESFMAVAKQMQEAGTPLRVRYLVNKPYYEQAEMSQTADTLALTGTVGIRAEGNFAVTYDAAPDAAAALSREAINAALSYTRLRLLGDLSRCSPQGICAVGDDVVIACPTTGCWMRVDMKTRKVTRKSFAADAYGHMNDITYNPDTNGIYVASFDCDVTGGIYVFDGDTLEYRETITVAGQYGAAEPWSRIAYDRANRRYVLMNTGSDYFCITDADFNIIKTCDTCSGAAVGTKQSIETDGERIYMLLWKTNCVEVYDFDGNKLMQQLPINNKKEPEGLTFDWNGNMYLLYAGGGMYRMEIQPAVTGDLVDSAA